MNGNSPLCKADFFEPTILVEVATNSATEAMRKVYYTAVKVCRTRAEMGTPYDDFVEAIG